MADVHIPSSEGITSVPFNHVSSPAEQSSSSPSALASLYVTFKVLQLVNVIRKRVKTRIHPTKEHRATVQEDFCQAFERQAYEDIDRQLGRKRLYPHLRCRRKGFGVGERDFPVPHVTFAEPNPATPTAADKRLDWLLHEIDRSVACDEHSFDIVARNNSLFLRQCLEFQVKHLSLKQLTHLIVIVKDLLATLNRAAVSTPKPKNLVNGTEIIDPASEDNSIDESYLANLQHLLLCLQEQLLRQLVVRCIELVRKHLVDCQKDQGKRCPEWFSEFPDAQHPLNTTWPWSIKPSLAVLWGVCWMFYGFGKSLDSQGNIVDAQGIIEVPSAVVHRYISAMQQQQQNQIQQQNSDDLYGLSLLSEVGLTDQQYADARSITNQVSVAAPHQNMGSGSSVASASPARFRPHHHHQQQQQQQQGHPFQRQQQQQQIHQNVERESWSAPSHGGYLPVPSPTDQPAVVSGDLALGGHFQAGIAGASNANFNTAPSVAYVDSGIPATHPRFLPQESFSTGFDNSNPSAFQSTDPVNGAAWSSPPAHSSRSVPDEQARSLYDQALPQCTHDQASAPTIRVTTQASNFASEPQDTTRYSASPASLSPHHTLAYNTTFPHQVHLSPVRGPSTYMHPETEIMQTPPRSPLGPPVDTNMSDTQPIFSRKRSHSAMSQNEHQQSSARPSRAPSLTSPSPVDETYPRSSRAFKRGDPPTNTDNKYVCEFAEECRGLVFERKCEWSKHMDKHDRPYRCPQPSCAKLQGFTYSGGLLRHEREVHGKHGGPKTPMMCPIEDCKRHIGKGFTRKENLNEHMRRVHSVKDHPSQGNMFRRDTQDTMIGAEDVETPASRLSEIADFDEHSIMSPAIGKRKRSIHGMSERATSEEVEDLKSELKRLRSEADRKDERIRQMEESGVAQDSKIRLLEEAVTRLQQQASS